jgi:Asp/Glu/hydantoin racemase
VSDEGSTALQTLIAIVREWTEAQVSTAAKIDALHARIDGLEREVHARGAQLGELVHAAQREAAAAEREAATTATRTEAAVAAIRELWRQPVVQQCFSVVVLGVAAWLALRFGVEPSPSIGVAP